MNLLLKNVLVSCASKYVVSLGGDVVSYEAIVTNGSLASLTFENSHHIRIDYGNDVNHTRLIIWNTLSVSSHSHIHSCKDYHQKPHSYFLH